ncbi:MAG: FecR domain-containing protein [Candidatus Omnitrophica bacterium]|nr:FecR domain-containing protein [Candidatus Omnitrophota bacterium]
MKRVLYAGIFALCVMVCATAAYSSVDGTFEVALVAVDGDVQVDEKGDGTWSYAIAGMRLKTGAGLKTGYDSSVDIVYDAEGLNLVSIDGDSRITISQESLELLKGSVLVKFDNMGTGSSFVVKTPTAACGIRGSGMGVDFIQGMTVVKAFEDRVYVQGLDARGNPVGTEIIIPEGWKTAVKEGGTSEPPEELSENEQKIWDAWIEIITGEGEEEGPGEEDEEPDPKDLDDVKDISPSQ